MLPTDCDNNYNVQHVCADGEGEDIQMDIR